MIARAIKIILSPPSIFLILSIALPATFFFFITSPPNESEINKILWIIGCFCILPISSLAHEFGHHTKGNSIAHTKVMKITSIDHTDCTNWLQFNPPQIQNILTAGPKTQISFGVLLTLITIPLVMFKILIVPEWLLAVAYLILPPLANFFDYKWEDGMATDWYWYKHPKEFLQFQAKRQNQSVKP